MKGQREKTTSSPNELTAPTRPVIYERRDYNAVLWPPEQFIVPLLRREIDFCIAKYATPALGHGKAVDIGCGGQPYRKMLEQIGYSYCGVDARTNDCPDVVCAIDEPLPATLLERGPFDFVLCTEVLEHVADWGAAFANLERLLGPGGRLLITAPYFYQLHEEPYDFWRPTPYAIDYHARRAGLGQMYSNNAGDGWDVLGTLLGSCVFIGSSRRIFHRALAKTLRVGALLARRALATGKIQKFVRAQGAVYLSNVVVLEKGRALTE